MSTFAAVFERQQDLFHRIARALDNAKKQGRDRLTRHSVEVRIATLDGNWDKFQENHAKLVSARTDETKGHPYFASDMCQECEEAYCEVKAGLLGLRDELGGAEAQTSSGFSPTDASATSNGSFSRALPKITFPRFSGTYIEWPSFRDLFHSLVGSSTSLSAVEKLHYLKTHLADEAARLLSNFSVTGENFERAWSVLVARYDNKRLLATAHLDRPQS